MGKVIKLRQPQKEQKKDTIKERWLEIVAKGFELKKYAQKDYDYLIDLINGLDFTDTKNETYFIMELSKLDI